MRSRSLGEREQRVLVEERVVLDLVGEQRRDLERAREHAGGEVRDAGVADPARLLQLAQRLQRPLERDVGVRPVQQEQVDVVGPSWRSESSAAALSRAGSKSSIQIFVVSQISPRSTPEAAMPGADLGLVAVRARGVDVPVADLQRVADAVGRVAAR